MCCADPDACCMHATTQNDALCPLRPSYGGHSENNEVSVCPCTGKIYPWDTYTGFHKIGFNPFLSTFAIFVIHGTFSYPSQVPDCPCQEHNLATTLLPSSLPAQGSCIGAASLGCSLLQPAHLGAP